MIEELSGLRPHQGRDRPAAFAEAGEFLTPGVRAASCTQLVSAGEMLNERLLHRFKARLTCP